MHSFSSVSKWVFALASIAVLHSGMASCAMRPATPDSYCILPHDADDPQDEKWSDYLYDHLGKRMASKADITKADGDVGYHVYVDYDAQMGTDYAVKHLDNGIKLMARDSEKMLWLIYSFIAHVGKDDKDIDVSDLPPSQISMDDEEGNFAFSYRGLYTPHSMNTDMVGILGVHNVDYDWGIWGHNLSKILSNKLDDNLYASSGGGRDNAQFCFTSRSLFNQIVAYINENYGNGDKGVARFAILPNDNDDVCLCSDCVDEGNSPGNASPAVASLVAKLAQKYPKHLFFMSAYRTTRKVPPYPMPQNVGVLVSSIDFPMKAPDEDNAAIQAFSKTIGDWKKLVSHVYVWDYMRNYDDYFTPYPCLGVLQKRLQYYKRNGVDGVFFNGSGNDYASFDGLHTYALAALLKNPDADVEHLVDTYFSTVCPSAHEQLSTYYISLEAAASASKEPLPLYGGMQELVRCYLDSTDFCQFHDQLPALAAAAPESEKVKLEKLSTALAFSRLELARASSSDVDKAAAQQWLAQLSAYDAYDDMSHYREAKGDTKAYVEEWQQFISSGSLSNRLKGRELTIQGTGDFTREQARQLTDGKLGFVSDWHMGWLITREAEWGVDLPSDVGGKGVLELSFLHAPVWHIYAPLTVKVYDGSQLRSYVPVPQPTEETDFQRTRCSVNLVGLEGRQLRVMFVRADDEGVKTACDEIILK